MSVETVQMKPSDAGTRPRDDPMLIAEKTLMTSESPPPPFSSTSTAGTEDAGQTPRSVDYTSSTPSPHPVQARGLQMPEVDRMQFHPGMHMDGLDEHYGYSNEHAISMGYTMDHSYVPMQVASPHSAADATSPRMASSHGHYHADDGGYYPEQYVMNKRRAMAGASDVGLHHDAIGGYVNSGQMTVVGPGGEEHMVAGMHMSPAANMMNMSGHQGVFFKAEEVETAIHPMNNMPRTAAYLASQLYINQMLGAPPQQQMQAPEVARPKRAPKRKSRSDDDEADYDEDSDGSEVGSQDEDAPYGGIDDIPSHDPLIPLKGNYIHVMAGPGKHQVKDFNILPINILRVAYDARDEDYILIRLVCDPRMKLRDRKIFVTAVSAKHNIDTDSEIVLQNLKISKDMLQGRTKGFQFFLTYTLIAGGREAETIKSHPFYIWSNVKQQGFPRQERDKYLEQRKQINRGKRKR